MKHIKEIHDTKTFMCDQCEYVTTWSGRLKKHNGITFPCDQCYYIADHMGRLKEHKTSQPGAYEGFCLGGGGTICARANKFLGVSKAISARSLSLLSVILHLVKWKILFRRLKLFSPCINSEFRQILSILELPGGQEDYCPPQVHH